jgi:hypothetical protein
MIAALSTGCPHGCQGYQWNMTYHHNRDCPLFKPAECGRTRQECCHCTQSAGHSGPCVCKHGMTLYWTKDK